MGDVKAWRSHIWRSANLKKYLFSAVTSTTPCHKHGMHMIFGKHTYEVSMIFMHMGHRLCIGTLNIVIEYDCKRQMTTWVVANESPEYAVIASLITMKTFAISKSDNRDRLIRWQCIQNATFPDPPHTGLPTPDVRRFYEPLGDSAGAFFMDVGNIFNNIDLLDDMAKLFPIHSVQL